jgi:foldase protein PrsA
MRKMRFSLVAILLTAVFMLLLAGCGRKGLVSVNGEKIAKEEFYARLERVPVQTVKGGKQVTVPAGQYVIEQMITEQLLTQLAKKENVAATDAQVENKLKYLKASTGGNFLVQLRQQGISQQEWKRQMQLQQSVVNLIGKGSKVTDADVRKAYGAELAKANSQFRKPEAVFISIIMTKGQDKIDKAYKLLQDGQDFGTVALQLSEDQASASSQGRLNWMTMNMNVVPLPIRQAAFAIGVGKYTKPFLVKDQKQAAWIIVRADNKRHATTDSYDQVKDLIKEQLAVKTANRKPFDKMLKDFIGESNIQVNAERYKNIPEMMKQNAGVPAELATGKAPTGAPIKK